MGGVPPPESRARRPRYSRQDAGATVSTEKPGRSFGMTRSGNRVKENRGYPQALYRSEALQQSRRSTLQSSCPRKRAPTVRCPGQRRRRTRVRGTPRKRTKCAAACSPRRAPRALGTRRHFGPPSSRRYTSHQRRHALSPRSCGALALGNVSYPALPAVVLGYTLVARYAGEFIRSAVCIRDSNRVNRYCSAAVSAAVWAASRRPNRGRDAHATAGKMPALRCPPRSPGVPSG